MRVVSGAAAGSPPPHPNTGIIRARWSDRIVGESSRSVFDKCADALLDALVNVLATFARFHLRALPAW
jgi:hypothetical protein